MDGRIAVLEAPETVTLESFPVPDPDADEAVVRIDLAGLDGTDVKNYPGDLPDSELSRYPQVLSDEIVGTVESIGTAAADRYGVAPGDRVIVGPRITKMRGERLALHQRGDASDMIVTNPPD